MDENAPNTKFCGVRSWRQANKMTGNRETPGMPLAGNGDRGQWSQDIRINASICTDDSGHRAGEGNFSSAACLSAELSRDGRYSRISANLRQIGRASCRERV